MSRIPDDLRKTIAANIRAERMKKYPGRGGGKQCAEAFGVSPRQWSPWERGMRTPDEIRLRQIADFFGTTVDDLRRAQAASENAPNAHPPAEDAPRNSGASVQLPRMACSESDIIWQINKVFTGMAHDGKRLGISFSLILSELKE